jgi:hypothetical protein
MPIPNNLMSVFLITVFGTTQGIDAVARDQALALLEFTDFDSTMVVMDYPQSGMIGPTPASIQTTTIKNKPIFSC